MFERINCRRRSQQLQNEIAAAAKRQRALDPRLTRGTRGGAAASGTSDEQANLSVQLDKVEDKIATGAPVGSSASAGTSVIQQATEATGPSTFVRLLVWGPLGALVCTILAAAVLLVASAARPACPASRRDRRRSR